MKLQATFKESYIKTLRENIVRENYLAESFPYDPSMIGSLANIYKPEGLAERMVPTDDYASAIALYEAYEHISPIVAANEAFWVYLTHVDLFDYNKKRWEKKLESDPFTENYIKEHWFYSSSGPMRTSLMGLWWSVHCSMDKSRGEERKYDLTKILLNNYHFRVNIMGQSVLFRHREALLSILEFIDENPELFSVFFRERSGYVMKHFNQLGAVKQLSYFGKEFFKTEIEKLRSVLLNTTAIR